MKNIFKMVIGAGLAFALVFYYVTLKQQRQEQKADVFHAESAKEKAEFDRDFTNDKKQKVVYQKRADEAGEKVKDAEAKLKPTQEKADQFNADFDKAIKEADKQLGK